MDFFNAFNDILWHNYVLYAVLGAGVLFTLWSGFSQYRAMTHGVKVIRGHYDRKDEPGAINHFQALSAALSATVGLGNIAGVALAIGTGGPGAVFWMWVVGFVGMALKLTEVIQAMLWRNLDDPKNPSGGAMWVISRGWAGKGPGFASFGMIIAWIFCITLLISTFTGGNMFQAWNVADISFTYFGIDQMVTGAVLTILVGLVILGGITRIGNVAGKLVPFMCLTYLAGSLYVVLTNLGGIPSVFKLIIDGAFSPTEGTGAFLGGVGGYAFLKGMQRALFSNEAGQGSSPIAHSAARTTEPVREGIVAGLEPFIDTLVVCTLTAMVILLSGEWNRGPDLDLTEVPAFSSASGTWTVPPLGVKVRDAESASGQMRPGQEVFLVVQAGENADTKLDRHRISGSLVGSEKDGWKVNFEPFESKAAPRLAVQGAYLGFKGATLTAKAFDRVLHGLGFWIVPIVAFLFALSTMISWSYYGEQGMVFMFGRKSVMPYRIIYCLAVFISCTKLIETEAELDTISSIGTGVMLWVNIPIMLLFGPQAMKAYHSYVGRLKKGEFDR